MRGVLAMASAVCQPPQSVHLVLPREAEEVFAAPLEVIIHVQWAAFSNRQIQ